MIVKSLALAVAALGLAFATSPAQATPLLPGTTVAPSAEATSPLSGTTIQANTGVQNFNITGGDGSTLVGTGQAWVVTGYSGNPFGLNDVSIVYQVSLTGGTTSTGGPQVLERVTGSSFDSFSTDAAYFVQSGGQVIPVTADRTGSGAIIAFDTFSIPAGATSALFIVNTNAPNFTTGSLTVQDGLTANLRGFSPTLAPEPSTVVAALTGVGLVGLGALRRKLRKPA